MDLNRLNRMKPLRGFGLVGVGAFSIDMNALTGKELRYYLENKILYNL